MKRTALLVLFAFLVIIGYSQGFRGGVLAGFVSSQLDGDTHGGYNKASVTFGGYVNHDLGKKFSGQMEMRFIQKGSYSSGKDLNDPVYYKSKLNYIEMPVMLNYQFGKLFFEAGLSAGYLISAYEDKDGYGDLPADPPFKTYEFCYIVGLNYQVFEKLKLNARFEYSLLPVRENPGTIYFTQNQFNNVLTFSVFYQL